MSPAEIVAFRAHAKTPGYRRRFAEMTAFLAERLDGCCYVSFSAGKDSSVVADACHRARPGIPILMVDPGCPNWWLDDERSLWRQHAVRRGWNLRLFPWDAWRTLAAGRDADTVGHHAVMVRSMFADLTTWADAHGLMTRVMGLRAEESPGRRMSAAIHGPDHVYADGRRRLLPIAGWGWRDVWAYIVTHDLPWLSVYDHGGPQARNCLVGRQGQNYGRLNFLRERYPEAYELAKALTGETCA